MPLLLAEVDRDDAHQVVIGAVFLVMMQDVMLGKVVAIDGAFAVGSVQAEPDGVDFLDLIVGRAGKLGFFLR